MLSELRIVDLGVIGEATIEPGPGFTAVTGETGAGKTMIVTGLALLTGAKADPKLVRTTASRALVEGRWRLDEQQQNALAELGAEVEQDEVLVARAVSASRSRMTIGGAQVPMATGAGLVGEWVTIHGQSEQLRLGSPERQLEVLDRYAGPALADELATYRLDYTARAAARAELTELTTQSQARARELDLLRFGLDEIAKADPQPGEDASLAVESVRLQAVDDLRQAAHTALVSLAGDDDDYDAPDALGLAGAARKALGAAVDADPQLVPITSQLADASAALADVASQLSAYAASLDADPLRLEWIAGRRAELAHLTRKYGDTVDEVLTWSAGAAERVLSLDAGDSRIGELKTAIAALDERLAASAGRLNALRRAAADELARLVAGELRALAMPKAKLEFELTDAELGPNGGDQVSLLFSANPGSVPGALGKVASGGELSRVRLGLEVVLASQSPGDTFVFDEVDAGVGGQVALEIGRRLARLAEHSQVIVVTHLAQVAAFADRHFLVSKADDGSVTTSGVRLVTDDDRLEVLATMMGGLESSDAAIAHAEELLASVRVPRVRFEEPTSRPSGESASGEGPESV
ncbi:MAG TPA: DNA repair protein RecN [Propionicimonas sp.]|nr:DNA repair protein RecN [Propionicimonas sp.]HRA06329.1 DNA repair protein RecN [Propionicimonas sp.]